MFRKCGECTACCTHLNGSAYGYDFGEGSSCRFLCSKGCEIHQVRPRTCMNYQCAWSQELLPEEMRPDKCGVIVSVENDINNNQYLKLTFIHDINKSILNYFREWGTKMNIRIIYFNHNQWEVLSNANFL